MAAHKISFCGALKINVPKYFLYIYSSHYHTDIQMMICVFLPHKRKTFLYMDISVYTKIHQGVTQPEWNDISLKTASAK